MLKRSTAGSRSAIRCAAMTRGNGDGTETVLRPKVVVRTERPKLHKVILLNDDYTPREFVVTLLRAVFRLSDGQAQRVMLTAHRRGACVIAVFTREIAEEKATTATETARKKGYPLLLTTEPEE